MLCSTPQGQLMFMAKDRVVSKTLSELEEVNLNPIFGYEDSLLLTLEEAVAKLIPFDTRLTDYVAKAKMECNQHSDLLTQDESAAVYLYTMPTTFYSRLNEALRAKNRHALKPWFDFLKLFITALKKLPRTNEIVWRGVFGQVGSVFDNNDTHIWWSVNSCSMNLGILRAYLGDNGTLFAIHAIDAKDITAFSAFPNEQEVLLMPGTRLRAKCQSLNFIDRLSVLHLEEVTSQENLQSESNYLFEQIKQTYQQNSRIERFMNPAKTFTIEQSYINLAIVKAKEQHDKEKQLQDVQYNSTIIDTFEEIYGMKTVIDAKDIFETCKTQQKQVLVFGRAGIGKSTFSRYIAYQWAKGSLWQQYQLLALIPLRRLTIDRYPSIREYSLIDLVKREVLQCDLTEKEEKLLKKHFDAKKTLWILDGYDEIVQNVPPHLKFLFEQLLKTPHHIITSRPYMNTLSYDVQMEITGFTNENIHQYVEQFFGQMKDEPADALIRNQTLLNFLESNSRIWGLVHIPINLELICSLWSNNDWSNTQHLSMTTLYSQIIEWLCRRYLAAKNILIEKIPKRDVPRYCEKELLFLEQLAFAAMESNSIIISPPLLERVMDEVQISSDDTLNILNFGVLKSYSKQGVGDRTETEKDHYFIHLSFQEYFAARYLINTLKGSQNNKVIQFIKYQKYNKRYLSVFSFAAGLLTPNEASPLTECFWNLMLGAPLDLVGIRHMQLVISCLEETSGKSAFTQRNKLLAWIARFLTKNIALFEYLRPSLQRAESLVCEQKVIDAFIGLLKCDDIKTKFTLLRFISELRLTHPSASLLSTLTTALDDANDQMRVSACSVLRGMGERAATSEVISKLARALGDQSSDVRSKACSALRSMGEKAATGEVISKLVSALGDQSEHVRSKACLALGEMGEKAATTEVISKLVRALEDQSVDVTSKACSALVEMGETVATSEVISKLVSALGDQSSDVISKACSALEKIGETVATSEVISKLVSALEDDNKYVRWYACSVLRKMGETAATTEVISKLVSALEDQSADVRTNACLALGDMSEKAATIEVISKLVSALGDDSKYVRMSAYSVLEKMGEKAATTEVISKLVSALEDQNEDVRINACLALEGMGETVATSEVISKLVNALEDDSEYVRINAYSALGSMGEKAATTEVISKLVSALEDQSEDVRINAYSALGSMGKKAATTEVISKLVDALGDQSKDVRTNACSAVGKMGEKAATTEVISKLVRALEDQSSDVRSKACSALGSMGEKAATSEVISKLVSALGDQSVDVTRKACSALGKMGEKAATSEVISKLVSALGDDSEYVRRDLCSVLRKMGEKAATSEVISKLVSALGDQSVDVRVNACLALEEMGETVATSEVIYKLVSALGDEWGVVRRNACSALGSMGEKAATSEVISKLVSALGDEWAVVRRNACSALGNMGEKAATNEVIRELGIMMKNESMESDFVQKVIGSILTSSAVIVKLDPELIAGLGLSKDAGDCFINISEVDIIRFCIETKSVSWLTAVAHISLLKETGVTSIEDKIVVFGSEEPIVLSALDKEFSQKLIKGLMEQRYRLYLDSNML